MQTVLQRELVYQQLSSQNTHIPFLHLSFKVALAIRLGGTLQF